MNLLRLAIVLLLFTAVGHAADEKGPQTVIHRITGLCYPERADELATVLKDQPKVKLVSVDYAHSEATFVYDPKQFSADSLNGMLGAKGFGVKPRLTIPADKLTRIEIAVVGLDCKGCCRGTYNAIYRLDGVEQATVSFKDGRVVALIDPAKTKQSVLEEALKKANVQLKAP